MPINCTISHKLTIYNYNQNYNYKYNQYTKSLHINLHKYIDNHLIVHYNCKCTIKRVRLRVAYLICLQFQIAIFKI